MATGSTQVDAYLKRLPRAQRETLEVVRHRLQTILPLASEGLTYGVPTFLLNGKGVAGYAGAAAHCSYFPMSGTVLAAAGRAVAGYSVSKGGLRFAIGKPLPVALLRRLVKLRLAELAGKTRTGTRTPRRASAARTPSGAPRPRIRRARDRAAPRR